MSDIKPALTAEEWAAQLSLDTGERRSRLREAVFEADEGGELTRHGLAALALYGQPFGFTRRDAVVIRMCAAMVNDSPEAKKMAERALETAAKIEALLPPETK